MEKRKKYIAIMAAAALLVGLAAVFLLIDWSGSGVEKHLILNADGSYGGSLSEELYGKGAPLNGQYDVKKSDYYTVNNDYYNMPSTAERTIVPQFASYQQTMQETSGLACLLMVLNYAGQDVKSTYNEQALLKRYEQVNGTQVYGNGTTEEGLIALVNDLGLDYTANNDSFLIESAASQGLMKEFFIDCMEEGKFVLVRYQSPVGFGWKVVIGYDDLGNIKNTQTEELLDSAGDDVVIFAEPYDGADHFQDGYATERAKDFVVWWRKMDVSNGDFSDKFSYVVIDPNIDVVIDRQPVDETVKQKLYEIHLPLNPDGTYGGTRDASAYGSITSGRGWWNHTDSNYYKISDFYNMGNKGSRLLLKNYTVLQQTMHSSCGICAVNSVLKYYGEEESLYDMELTYLNDYEDLNSTRVKGKGSSVAGHHITLNEWGYRSEYGYMYKAPVFPAYEKYRDFMVSHLKEGRPIVVSTFLGSGHFLTVIGFDDMGTDYIYDDVFVTADSCDYWDGYQDGYNVFSAYKFFSQHTNSKYTTLQSHLVVYDKED